MNPKEKFLNDVSDHRLEIIKDDGLHRHIKLSKPDSSDMWFGIVTWPGYLCIHGDMGDFLFRSRTDPFKFFRRNGDDWDINADHWAQKLEAPRWNDDSVKRFNLHEATKQILELFEDWKGDLEEDEVHTDTLEKLTDSVRTVMKAEDEHEFVTRVRDFEDLDTSFDLDNFFFDSEFKSYTYHYLWCCHAIVWAIQQYDAQKQAMTEKLSFIMNGFRQNLSEDLKRLKESVINVANQEYFITEELVDDTNAIICASNALNCIWVSGDEHFKNMEDVELGLIEFDGETAS